LDPTDDLRCPLVLLRSGWRYNAVGGRRRPVATVKQLVLDVLEALPDDCPVEDVQYELYLRQRVAEGEHAADAGEFLPHGDVLREAREWLRRL
jgi:hypothetical protein